jgi:hypothetical protein
MTFVLESFSLLGGSPETARDELQCGSSIAGSGGEWLGDIPLPSGTN